MLPRHSPVDDYDSEVPTAPNGPNADSDREPTVMRHLTPVEMAVARPSARALYVPSPLPMAELKKALARADDEATLHSAAAFPVADNAPPTSMVPSSAPTRLHVHREVTPLELAKTSLAQPEERRLSSNVDKDEAKLGYQYPIPPLPSLDEFAPIDHSYGQLPVSPDSSARLSHATARPQSHGLRTAALFAVAVISAGMTIGIASGDLTKNDALNAVSMVRSAAEHVAANVRRL